MDDYVASLKRGYGRKECVDKYGRMEIKEMYKRILAEVTKQEEKEVKRAIT